MKLQHFIGGLEGLPQPLTLDRRVFAEDWERRIFGIHVAMMALSASLQSASPAYRIDEVPTAFRHSWTWADLRTGAEAMDPFDYFRLRYYEKWLSGITAFLVGNGYLSEDELALRVKIFDENRASPAARPTLLTEVAAAIDEQVLAYLRGGDNPRRDIAHPRFSVGQHVRVTNVPAGAHTRLPGYLRGRCGTVTEVFEGDYVYFCQTDDGIGDPMPVYLVKFAPAELWGPRAELGTESLYAELFQAYLEERT
jgi:nitrile hydratase beta subunit